MHGNETSATQSFPLLPLALDDPWTRVPDVVVVDQRGCREPDTRGVHEKIREEKEETPTTGLKASDDRRRTGFHFPPHSLLFSPAVPPPRFSHTFSQSRTQTILLSFFSRLRHKSDDEEFSFRVKEKESSFDSRNPDSCLISSHFSLNVCLIDFLVRREDRAGNKRQ